MAFLLRTHEDPGVHAVSSQEATYLGPVNLASFHPAVVLLKMQSLGERKPIGPAQPPTPGVSRPLLHASLLGGGCLEGTGTGQEGYLTGPGLRGGSQIGHCYKPDMVLSQARVGHVGVLSRPRLSPGGPVTGQTPTLPQTQVRLRSTILGRHLAAASHRAWVEPHQDHTGSFSASILMLSQLGEPQPWSRGPPDYPE